MTAREEMLRRIRARLGRDGGDYQPVRADEETDPPPRPVVGEDLVAHFAAKAESMAATVELVDSPEKVPRAIAAYLESRGIDLGITKGNDPWLCGMPWADAHIEVAVGDPRKACLTGVSHAAFAVAETGTVVLASGAENPVTLNYLPEYHIVVVKRTRVVAFQEEVWRMFLEGVMPRALSFISGPSRTGDIEFDIQLGAHGPRNLHVMVVASD